MKSKDVFNAALNNIHLRHQSICNGNRNKRMNPTSSRPGVLNSLKMSPNFFFEIKLFPSLPNIIFSVKCIGSWATFQDESNGGVAKENRRKIKKLQACCINFLLQKHVFRISWFRLDVFHIQHHVAQT